MTIDTVSETERPRAVRDGQMVPVTCGACGCRLESIDTTSGMAWFHFGRLGGRDARGCNVACVETRHDASGRVSVAA
jgi:hypothetical protein